MKTLFDSHKKAIENKEIDNEFIKVRIADQLSRGLLTEDEHLQLMNLIEPPIEEEVEVIE